MTSREMVCVLYKLWQPQLTQSYRNTAKETVDIVASEEIDTENSPVGKKDANKLRVVEKAVEAVNVLQKCRKGNPGEKL